MKNKIQLVTGAAGFIGHKVSQQLLERGDVVVGIDNMNEYYDIRLKQYRISELSKYSNFIFHKIDIEDFESCKFIFSKYNITAVFNLAARAGVRSSIANPWIYMRTNSEGTLNLLELMKDYDVKKFILSSTSSLYAGELQIPFKENLPVNNPISPYAASKKAAEIYAYTYHKLYGIDVSILRYFTVFGPLGRPDMAPYRFCKMILEGLPIDLYGDGNYSRDFSYIDDIAYGTVLAEKELGFEIINLGGGNNPTTINRFIKHIEIFTGKKAQINYHPSHPSDMEITMADISKAELILGWQPKTSVEEGIKKMIINPSEFRFNTIINQ